jgi:hypothetical protein
MSRARELAKLGNENVISVDANNQIGIGSVTPDRRFDVGTGDLIVGAAITLGSISGIVSATAFHGDGSNLEGVASAGLGTALGAVEGRGDDVIYYTNKVLNINDDVTLDPPTSTNTAYTQYAEIVVADSKDLIIASGDEFIPDILGLSTAGVSEMSGTGGRLRVGSITNKAGTGAPDLVNGVVVSGIATFTDNVSIAGTLTYDDVTNIDSVGIVTAGKGFRATTGGLIVTAGVSTFTAAVDANSTIDVAGHSTFNTIKTSGITTVSATTGAGSSTTGSLIVSGGVGIAKSVFVGDGIILRDGGDAGVSGTRTGNTLDCYEEGTFTPVLTTGSGAVGTYASQIGRYTKIGRMVYCTIYLQAAKGTGDGTTTITGLPFTSVDAKDQWLGTYLYYAPGASNDGTSLKDLVNALHKVSNDSTTITLHTLPNDNENLAPYDLDWGICSTTLYIRVATSFCYEAAA